MPQSGVPCAMLNSEHLCSRSWKTYKGRDTNAPGTSVNRSRHVRWRCHARSPGERENPAIRAWPILSLHWGPNMEFRPSMQFRQLAHAAIGMGWKILFGHSAHVFQAIEIYRGCPIIYAAGDLVDDYYVGPGFKNDRQLLFEMELSRSALTRIDLHPVFIEDCRTQLATKEQSDYIVRWMTAICKEIGARVQQDGGKIWIAGTDP